MTWSHLSLPRTRCGIGTRAELPAETSRFQQPVFVTGKQSWATLAQQFPDLAAAVADYPRISVQGEPTADFIDASVRSLRKYHPDAVCAIGGGSVLDAGKAIAALIPHEFSCGDACEGVGDIAYPGGALPIIAVPTTAGTGAEATRNAVIHFSATAERAACKKSLRHDSLTPEVAIIDPELATLCSPHVTAASGLDAITQLIESILSPQCSPWLRQWCLGALGPAYRALLPAATSDANNLAHRQALAEAAYISGCALGVSGLGVVHGFAPIIGAGWDIPHGVACGLLLPASMAVTHEQLQRESSEHPAQELFAEIGRSLANDNTLDRAHAQQAVPQLVEQLVSTLCADTILPRLGDYAIAIADIEPFIADKILRQHPVPLDHDQLLDIWARSQ